MPPLWVIASLVWVSTATAVAGVISLGAGRWWLVVAGLVLTVLVLTVLVLTVLVLTGFITARLVAARLIAARLVALGDMRAGAVSAWAARLPTRLTRLVPQPIPPVRTLVLALLLGVVITSASATWRVLPLVDSALALAAQDRARVVADIDIVSDPQRAQGYTAGSRRTDDSWRVRAVVRAWQRPGSPGVVDDLPITVTSVTGLAGLLPGTSLRVTGRLGPGDPLRATAALLVAEDVRITGQPPLVQLLAGEVRSSLRASVAGKSPDVTGLLPGLVVGDTSKLPDDLAQAMRDSGLAHLNAVSGGNVAIIVVLGIALLRSAGVRRGRLQVVLLGLIVGAYVVIARPEPSVMRAAAMAGVVLFALVFDLHVRPLNALALAVGGLVLIDPFLAVSLGFAMSAAATAALIALTQWWSARAKPTGLLAHARHLLLGAMVATGAAELAVAPFVVSLGNGLPLGGVLANLLAGPLVAPATIFGIVAAFVGLVSAPIAAILVLPGCWAVGFIAHVAREVSAQLAPLPWPGGLPGTASAIVVVGMAIVGWRNIPSVRIRRVCAGFSAIGLLLVVAPAQQVPSPLASAVAWPPVGWRVVMCDVGQGDALVLRVDDTTAVAIDAGPDPRAEDQCLRHLGITRIPVIVLTHFHADHVEGLPGLLRGRDLGVIEVSPLVEPATEARRVRSWLADRGVTTRTAAPGDVITVGPVTMRVLWPMRLIRGQGSDPNNASVAVLADVSGLRVLLAGDLEPAAQEAVLASGQITRVDVVKVPHHGSAKQSPGWATTARPRIALIGVGLHNDYGHPNSGTIAQYRSIGATIGRTDLDGDLAVVVDPAGQLSLVRRGR
ncbi:MAG: ComEC/Rec2 family competence protein [Actinomycetes bacterium]